MDNDMLEKLNAIDPAILTDVVRQDQNNPFFEITEWNVKRLSDKGVANPDGLWLFSGQGNNGKEKQLWSVVLKILERQEEEPSTDDLWYWKREYLLAQSRLTENIAVKAPRFYHSEETSDGAWIWMEHVGDHHPGKWTLDEYAFAAYQLGRWNSTYLIGTPLPNANWLTRQHYRTWLSFVNPEEDWKFSLNQKHVSNEVRNRYERLWKAREKFYGVLERLPQVFSHFDSQRRNLLICTGRNHQDELVALDWAQCGIGAAGAELNWLVGMSSALMEWQPIDLPKLDTVAFQNYVQGLQEGGWSGDVDVVRLGYVSMLAVFMGCAFPSLVAFWCSAEKRELALQILGLAEEELFLQTLPLLHYALDCADEARSLMKKLGVSSK
jgi:hypothetical protein